MQLRAYRHLSDLTKIGFVWAVLGLSLLPFLIAVVVGVGVHGASPVKVLDKLPIVGASYAELEAWAIKSDDPVQELRPLATFPSHWQGSWFDIDKNYFAFQKWFSDNLAFRSLMIRVKNETDYRLFHTSSRVYFGQGDAIYGRSLVDRELPFTESILDTDAKRQAIYRGVVALSNKLKSEGVASIFVTPMMKEYFLPGELPFFATRLPSPSNFMRFYVLMKGSNDLNFVDVYDAIQSIQPNYQIYYRQDFHWTDISALEVSKRATNMVAKLANSNTRFDHPIVVEQQPVFGTDARFAALLNQNKTVESVLKKTWSDRHTFTERDVGLTHLEFESDLIEDPKLLPPTCLYGNSFSDGMIRAGIADYYQKFTKIDRALPLTSLPEIVKGRCRFVIVQILDLSTMLWLSLSK